jgi:glutamate N-acetyltransferase/amino-acid N-acetyltransferase
MNTDFEWIAGGGVTTPQGYRACGAAAGLKVGRDDLALLVSDAPAAVAGVFTSNKVAAAPVALDRERVAAGQAQAVVVNAGCANACTGREGYEDARQMAHLAARELGLRDAQVLVCSTGVIGRRLPMDRIANGIRAAAAALSPEGGDAAARAILTTDTVDKQAALRLQAGGCAVRIGGMCKGAGMIEPELATMLAFLTTDARVEPEALHAALKTSVDRSFNRITIDGDQSTNDTVLLFANGAAGGETLSPAHHDWPRFVAALRAVCLRLAHKIVADGEGATKFVTVQVLNAASPADALAAARAVANSPLFKTACFGGDPNWGRVICAVGYSGAQVDELRTQIRFDDVCVYDKGRVADATACGRLAAVMAQKAFAVTVDLNLGSASDTVYTCDFSYDYVKINGEYTT